MAHHLSELTVGHAYAPIHGNEETFSQQIDQLLAWTQSMNTDLSAVILSAIMIISFFAFSFYFLTSESESKRFTAVKRALIAE